MLTEITQKTGKRSLQMQLFALGFLHVNQEVVE